MAILSLDEIMAAHDITEKEVPIPEWGGEVVVRSISHREMRNIKKKIEVVNGEVDEDEVEKWVLIEGLVNPKIDSDQYELLLEKSTTAITKVLTEILGNSNATDKSVVAEEKTFPAESVGVLPVSTGGGTAQDGAGTSDGSSSPAE